MIANTMLAEWRKLSTIFCAACGETISAEAVSCPKCGQPNRNRVGAGTGPVKSRTTAAILAFLLGGFGAHKFYLGKVGLGFVYLLFFWTFIPAIIALVEFVIYLTQDDATFAAKNNVSVA
jgi:TM2 domain-containing membrane protein YozV/ribosomal protein L40E